MLSVSAQSYFTAVQPKRDTRPSLSQGQCHMKAGVPPEMQAPASPVAGFRQGSRLTSQSVWAEGVGAGGGVGAGPLLTKRYETSLPSAPLGETSVASEH